jgi:uncharacterized protein YbaP (TraB family)
VSVIAILKESFTGMILVRPFRLACLCLLTLAVVDSQVMAAEGDRALLWSLSRQGETAGYLLGTIHSEDPRVLDFPAEFLEKLESCEVFAMEMVPDLTTLTRLTNYMQYQDGRTLAGEIGPERYERVLGTLSNYQVPADWVARMKVWATVMTLSVPPPETGFFMDFSLSLRAAGAGLNVVGLETLEEQLSFLENMPMDQQLSLLDQALNEYHQVQEVHDEMVRNYLQGDLQALQAAAREQLGELDQQTRDYFIGQGIDARNHRMIESLLPQLEKSRVFVAVGALHLPGDEGLVQLLREAGYELEPQISPFRND